MTDLQALHQALSEAEGPDVNLDGAMWLAFGQHYDGQTETPNWALTHSLDAITSLIERVLPESCYNHAKERDAFGPKFKYAGAVQLGGAWLSEKSDTAALALCLALVSALIAQEGEK